MGKFISLLFNGLLRFLFGLGACYEFLKIEILFFACKLNNKNTADDVLGGKNEFLMRCENFRGFLL